MRKNIVKSLMHLFPKADPMWDFIVVEDDDGSEAAEKQLATLKEENEQLRNHVAELQSEIDTLRPPAPAPVYEVPYFTGGPVPTPAEAPEAQPAEPTPEAPAETPAEDPVTPVPTPATPIIE